MSLRLSMLGGPDLQDPQGRSVASILAQPKRFGLLAYLVAASPRGFHERDALLALLWPEQGATAARNALRQALHHLRKALGGDVFEARGSHAVRIDPARLQCDLLEFQAARERGDFGKALALYVGDVLPGFTVADAAPFNEWLDATRARVRDEAARTAWALADEHERRGDRTAAAAGARRAAALIGDDEHSLRQILSLLDRVGDSSGALSAYDAFAERLRRQLDIAPGADTQRLVQVIRSRSLHPATPSIEHAASIRPSGMRPVVLVRPFANLTGDAALDYVGRLAASAITTQLGHARLVDIHPVEDGTPPSALTGGELVVEGSYHVAQEQWQLSATLREVYGRQLGHAATAASRRERPWEATEAVAQRIVGAIGAHVEPRVASWADAVGAPPSFEAHQSHVLGVELHLRGEYRAAISHFLAAASTDAGFAVPLLWAIQASCNLQEFDQAAAVHADLMLRRARLAPAERFVCDYYGAWLRADRGNALRFLREAASLVPNTELLVHLGRDALLLNRVRYAVETLERVDPEAGWVPSWTAYWQRLTEAYHRMGDHTREIAAARRARQQHPEAMGPRLYEARAAAALGDTECVLRCADDAVALGADRFATAADVLLAAAQELRAHGHPGLAAELLDRAIEWQRERPVAQGGGSAAATLLACTYYEAGRWKEATAILDDGSVSGVDAMGLNGALAARSGNGAATDSIAALKAIGGQYQFGRQLLWAARVSAVLGDNDAALNFLRGAFARGLPHDIGLHTDIDLAALRSDSRFEALLRPAD